MDDAIHLKYLVVSPLDLKWGLAVHSVGFQDIAPGMPYPPGDHPSRYLFSEERGRTLNEYQLLYITRGKGMFTSASLGRWVPVNRGSMFLLFPGEWHSYRPDKDSGWKEYWIGFQGPVIDSRVENGFFSKEKPVFNVGLHGEIAELYEHAIKAASSQESGFQPLLGSIVVHLLGLCYYYARNRAFRATEASDLIGRAKLLISEQFRTIGPEQVAQALCMGYSNFRRIFKEYTGLSPAKYIQEVRFSRTKEALTNTDRSVKEIAYDMGFENYEYFFTAFRRMAGMTPAEYRALTQGLSG